MGEKTNVNRVLVENLKEDVDVDAIILMLEK
jgi:hypothetical protein